MGQLEERIVASLRRFVDSDADCDACMFVFPTSLMTRHDQFDCLEGIETYSDGPVLKVCRRPIA
ncbi:hypothetical protein EON82_23285 [bacterium]|nr:MAG: hypothetical protein EON82_23285 [bacterium]